eukprot:scaffold293_cov267-Prasinococcus_capsulatus_cf.AAC.11
MGKDGCLQGSGRKRCVDSCRKVELAIVQIVQRRSSRRLRHPLGPTAASGALPGKTFLGIAPSRRAGSFCAAALSQTALGKTGPDLDLSPGSWDWAFRSKEPTVRMQATCSLGFVPHARKSSARGSSRTAAPSAHA